MKPSKSDNAAENSSAKSITGFGRPFGINQDQAGYFYITDMDYHTVFKISPDLQDITRLDIKNLHGPHSIEFDAERVYITNYYTPAIKVYNLAFEFLYEIVLTGPASSFFDNQGRLLVAEYQQNSILAYDSNGKFLGKLGHDFDRPHMVKQGPDGRLYIADTWNNRIQVLDTNGQLITIFTHPQLQQPVAISFLNSNIIVTSWGNNSILCFNPQGQLLTHITELNLNKPYDAQIFHPWLVVADSHNHRVLFVNCLQNINISTICLL